MEQKNWSVVRRVVGDHRYDTPAQLDLLNRIYAMLPLQTNLFSPQQKLVEKDREGAKVTKGYDTAQTPYQRGPGRQTRPEKGQDRTSPTVRAAHGDVRCLHAGARGR